MALGFLEGTVALSGFSSLFEVAIGINLATSLWDSLRNNAVISFDRRVDTFKLRITASCGTPPARMCAKIESKAQKHKHRLMTAAKWGHRIGLTTCIFLVSLLIWLGFENNAVVTILQASAFTFFSFMPIVLLQLAGRVYLKYSIKRLERETAEYVDTVEEIKGLYSQS
ncbi:hypothetical protein QXB69_000519 [Vibrio fluvialis]|nr:hypothetical protein [Vibrio fluvialis]